MFIHYDNEKKEDLITDVLSIEIIDECAIITLRNEKELTINLNQIKAIIDDEILTKAILNGYQRIF